MLQYAKKIMCKYGVTGLLVLAMVCVSSLAMAQAPIPIPIDVPNFDYTAVVTTLLGVIGGIAAAAIGLGLSVWCVKWVYRLFKGMAK